MIGPRPRPTRPLKRSGLAFGDYNIKAACDSTYLLDLVAALDWAGVAVASVVNDIKSVGQGDTIAVKADAFSVEGGKSLVDAAVAKRGRFDILVLTAGIMGSKPIADVDEAFFDHPYS